MQERLEREKVRSVFLAGFRHSLVLFRLTRRRLLHMPSARALRRECKQNDAPNQRRLSSSDPRSTVCVKPKTLSSTPPATRVKSGRASACDHERSGTARTCRDLSSRGKREIALMVSAAGNCRRSHHENSGTDVRTHVSYERNPRQPRCLGLEAVRPEVLRPHFSVGLPLSRAGPESCCDTGSICRHRPCARLKVQRACHAR